MEEQPKPRRFRSRRRPVNDGARNDEEGTEEKVERERAPRSFAKSVPVPMEYLGNRCTGKIFDVIKRFKSMYGFILIDVDDLPRSEKPKIYFNNKDFDESIHVARKGYEVEFVVAKDDEGRLYASNVHLTLAGNAAAVVREERIASGASAAAAATSAANRANNAQTQRVPRADGATQRRPRNAPTAAGASTAAADASEDAEKVRKPRRPRPTPNETSVLLTVACDGKTETTTIDTKIFQSIGKLKYAAVEFFQVPENYTIYCQRTAENPKGVMLNKTLLRSLTAGDQVFIGPPPPEADV